MTNAVIKYWKSLFRPKPSLDNLRNWNQYMALIHLVQGIVILAISTSKLFPVNTNYLTVDPLASQVAGHPVSAEATKHLFDLNIAYLVAAFFFISAIAHWLAAFYYRKNYEADLKKNVNKLRWIEYGLSAGIMMIIIGFLSGIYDLSSLIFIFAIVFLTNLAGLAVESYNRGVEKSGWLGYVVGCIAGIIPWAVLLIYVIGANVYGTSIIPTFVYWIYLSVFILFICFAINVYLQYKKIGNWANYLYGERTYMILGLVVKTLLAWQVFAGILRT